MDCSLPGSSIHGILQARILEWVAISFSRGSSQPRDWALCLPHCRRRDGQLGRPYSQVGKPGMLYCLHINPKILKAVVSKPKIPGHFWAISDPICRKLNHEHLLWFIYPQPLPSPLLLAPMGATRLRTSLHGAQMTPGFLQDSKEFVDLLLPAIFLFSKAWFLSNPPFKRRSGVLFYL